MKQKALCATFLLLVCFFLPSAALSSEVIFEEDFESGWGDYWSASNGIWEIGIPTAGPELSYSGSKCAGTILDSNYASHTDSRLVSPSLTLPAVDPTEEIKLCFMNWFSYSSYDYGYIQISLYDENNNLWSDWESIKEYGGSGSTIGWWPATIDLTDYAARKIKICFYHTADRYMSYSSESTGWYIDDIQVVTQTPAYLIGDFESGMSGWIINNGLWEIGSPEEGPDSAYSGEQCVGTNLEGNYSTHADSRLISPTLMLPEIDIEEEIHLRFFQWFSYSSYDYGYIQISSFDKDNQLWSEWEDIGILSQTSGIWSMADLDLTDYACQRIRIAFYHTADRYMSYGSESTGWYIDDVRLVLPDRFEETESETGEVDTYEPDDTRAQAGITDLNEGTIQLHSFHQSGDQDWIKLYGNKRQVYTFNVTDVGSRANLVLNIYDGDTDYLLKRYYVQAECEKSISWTCPEDGLYYVAMAQTNPEIYGDDTQYSLEIYPSFTVEPATLELNEGASDTITIRGGKAPYTVVSSDKSIASVQSFTQAGVFVKVEGLSEGTASISISDSSPDTEAQQVTVTVIEAAEEPPAGTVSKAIIVAGGGPYQGNALWDTTQALARYVYIALLYQGFTRDTIQYLSPDTDVDMDGNGLYDDADAYADNDNLQEAVTDWALDANDVLIFITDHGGDGNFLINETKLLQAVDLDQWLDELQEVIPGRVTVVYDACHSGSFLSALTPPEGKERILIASTKPEQEAYFTSFGDLSFSSFFWQHIINGMNVFDAFIIAKNSIEYTYARQMPQLDDNGTGIGNENMDGELAKDVFIGTGLISGGGIPVIDGVSPSQTLMEEETSAVLYAENVIDSDGIERVWAVITPPDYDPGDTEEPVLDMPVVEMINVGGSRYQGIYNEFTLTGTYNVAVYAKDVLGGIAVPSQTKVVKLSNEISPATFDTAGLLTIPCLDLQGTNFSLKLFLTSFDTMSFQMTDISQVDACSPCATFDMETGVLHVNELDMGASYWVDLSLTGMDPFVFSLSNLGANE